MTKRWLGVVTLFLLAGSAVADDKAVAPTMSDDEQTIYALGYLISQQIATFGLDEKERKILVTALEDGMAGRSSKVDQGSAMPKLQALAQTRAARTAEVERKAGQAYLEKAAQEKGAKKLDSGIVVLELVAGTGVSPTAASSIKVNYKGSLIDGTEFDASDRHGGPATVPLTQFIPCWQEVFPTMKVGGKAKVVCPADKAYGDQGFPPAIKPGATLVFEVELLGIEG